MKKRKKKKDFYSFTVTGVASSSFVMDFFCFFEMEIIEGGFGAKVKLDKTSSRYESLFQSFMIFFELWGRKRVIVSLN